MDLMIPRSFTRVENSSVTVPVLNPMRVKTELPASLPLIRVERVNSTIASIEQLVPRATDVRPLDVTPDMRQEMVERLRKELNERAPIPSIPGVTFDEADLTPEEKQLFALALQSVIDVFAATDLELGATTLEQHQIDTGDAVPLRQRAYRVPFRYRREMEKIITDMLVQGVIEPSNSPWASSIVLVPKHDGSLRFCVDYRKLNAVIRKDSYPVSRIDELLDSLNQGKYFTSVDLQSG